MQISNKLAGYSLGDGRYSRRAMGKKSAVEMAKQRERCGRFQPRRAASQEDGQNFDLMEQFAGTAQ